jgi:hypothetical protein
MTNVEKLLHMLRRFWSFKLRHFFDIRDWSFVIF